MFEYERAVRKEREASRFGNFPTNMEIWEREARAKERMEAEMRTSLDREELDPGSRNYLHMM